MLDFNDLHTGLLGALMQGAVLAVHESTASTATNMTTDASTTNTIISGSYVMTQNNATTDAIGAKKPGRSIDKKMSQVWFRIKRLSTPASRYTAATLLSRLRVVSMISQGVIALPAWLYLGA
jgi:hypothetical protein